MLDTRRAAYRRTALSACGGRDLALQRMRPEMAMDEKLLAADMGRLRTGVGKDTMSEPSQDDSPAPQRSEERPEPAPDVSDIEFDTIFDWRKVFQQWTKRGVDKEK